MWAVVHLVGNILSSLHGFLGSLLCIPGLCGHSTLAAGGHCGHGGGGLAIAAAVIAVICRPLRLQCLFKNHTCQSMPASFMLKHLSRLEQGSLCKAGVSPCCLMTFSKSDAACGWSESGQSPLARQLRNCSLALAMERQGAYSCPGLGGFR